MKGKIYVRVSILFFILSISVFIYALSLTGLFDKNKILIKALACDTCAGFQVVMGSFKLSGPAFDTVTSRNLSEVYVTGASNPFAGDYTKTYDYYIITETVTGIKQVRNGAPWSPVVTVSAWQHVYLSAVWPFILIILLLLGISVRFHRRFINANKMSVLQSSLMTHEDLPD